MQSFSLAELARRVGGETLGEGATVIRGAAPLESAGAGDITFVDNKKLAPRLKTTAATAVIVPRSFDAPGLPAIHVEHVQTAFRTVYELFHPVRPPQRIGVSASAFVSPTARLGENVDIFPGATIGPEVTVGDGCVIHAGVHVMAGCQIGEGTILFPGAVLYPETRIGRRVIIHANVVIGAYGFGYEMVDGRHRLGPQYGNVVIEDDVEIGAGATIDRGAFGPTVIGEGTKIDDQVMVAHNCHIGRHNVLCSQVGVAGSVTTGDYVVMAGQVGVRDHVTIGERAMLAAKAGVMNSVPAGEVYAGIPATPIKDQKLLQAAIGKLPELRKTVKSLQRALGAVETGGETDIGDVPENRRSAA